MCITVLTEGLEEPCKRKDLGDGVYAFDYYPTTPGTYIITITWGGQHIPRRYTCLHGTNTTNVNYNNLSVVTDLSLSLSDLFSPIEVKVGAEASAQKVRAWGPGLECGVVGKSADFVVEAVGDNVGTLGNSKNKRDCFQSLKFALLTDSSSNHAVFRFLCGRSLPGQD